MSASRKLGAKQEATLRAAARGIAPSFKHNEPRDVHWEIKAAVVS